MITYRNYPDDIQYRRHQGQKIQRNTKLLKQGSSREWIERFVHEFGGLIRFIPDKKASVLCMGARRGAEVVAFRQFHLDAIGIDINPGPQSLETFGDPECAGVVEKGDFHQTRFPDGHFGMVYCNCLDHCRSLVTVFREMERLLTPGGIVILRLANHPKGDYETCLWDDQGEVVSVLRLCGFCPIHKVQTMWGSHRNLLTLVARQDKKPGGPFDPCIICPGDPSATPQRIKQYAEYYQTKADIVRGIRPKRIVEIGVRAGYSAWAFMTTCPDAEYVGIDAENGLHGGRGGPWGWWTAHLLESLGVKFELIAPFDTQAADKLPVKGDFYHIDGDHSEAGVMHDLDLCFAGLPENGHMLVDDIDYNEAAQVRVGVQKWLDKHTGEVVAQHIPSLRGEMLIRRK